MMGRWENQSPLTNLIYCPQNGVSFWLILILTIHSKRVDHSQVEDGTDVEAINHRIIDLIDFIEDISNIDVPVRKLRIWPIIHLHLLSYLHHWWWDEETFSSITCASNNCVVMNSGPDSSSHKVFCECDWGTFQEQRLKEGGWWSTYREQSGGRSAMKVKWKWYTFILWFGCPSLYPHNQSSSSSETPPTRATGLWSHHDNGWS